jgi:hypothetical protein
MEPQISLPVPPSRVPFVNTELAIVARHGKTLLTIGTWMGKGAGRIYFIDPETGESTMRLLPDGEPGAYMLQTAGDGRLYIGGGAGGLFRYDPKIDEIETLVTRELNGITWGGCVTDRYVVWSANPGDACVYDWSDAKLLHRLSPLDPATNYSRYGHRAIQTPDGKVMVAMSVPQFRFVILDPLTGVRHSVIPEELDGCEWTRDATFTSSDELILFYKGELRKYQYPTLKLSSRIITPDGVEDFSGRVAIISGNIYAISNPDSTLRVLKPNSTVWEIVCENFGNGMHACLHAVDDHWLCAVNVTGEFSRYDIKTKTLFRKRLDATGPVGTHAMCVVPELGKVYGAPFINMQFWDVDIATGKGRDLGRASGGGGQINGIVWDFQSQRVLMAAYASCAISAYDPSSAGTFPDNPKIISYIGSLQMRPRSFVHDGRHLWIASTAKYGHHGGALARLDPLDGSSKCWRHLVPNQSPNRLVADPTCSRIYISTDIYADCDSTPAVTKSAHLVSFDTHTLAIAGQVIPFENADAIVVLAILEPGCVLCRGNNRLFSWEPAERRITDFGPTLGGINEVARTPDGRLYTSVENSIGSLELVHGRMTYKPLVPENGRFLQYAAGKLWYVSGQMVRAVTVSEAKT